MVAAPRRIGAAATRSQDDGCPLDAFASSKWRIALSNLSRQPQVGVEVQRRAEALDEGDSSGAGAGAHAQSGAAHEGGGNRPIDDTQDLGEHRGACREQEP